MSSIPPSTSRVSVWSRSTVVIFNDDHQKLTNRSQQPNGHFSPKRETKNILYSIVYERHFTYTRVTITFGYDTSRRRICSQIRVLHCFVFYIICYILRLLTLTSRTQTYVTRHVRYSVERHANVRRTLSYGSFTFDRRAVHERNCINSVD